MYFGIDSRWWNRKTVSFLFLISFIHKLSHIAVLVKNPSGKILYLCVLIPQSKYVTGKLLDLGSVFLRS